MDRGEIDDELALAICAGQAVVAEHHFFHRRCIGEAHEDDAGMRHDIARTGRCFRTGLYQSIDLAR
jgi:hypothetical protein